MYLRRYPDRSHPGVTALPTLDLKSTALGGPEIGASEDPPADHFQSNKDTSCTSNHIQAASYTFNLFSVPLDYHCVYETPSPGDGRLG